MEAGTEAKRLSRSHLAISAAPRWIDSFRPAGCVRGARAGPRLRYAGVPLYRRSAGGDGARHGSQGGVSPQSRVRAYPPIQTRHLYNFTRVIVLTGLA